MEEIDQYKALQATKPTGDQRITYFLSSLVTVSVPIYLYQTIFYMPLADHLTIFLIVTICSALVLSFAYQNVSHWLNNRLLAIRERDISSVNVSQEPQAKGEKRKSLVQKKKDELLASTAKESMTFSILYNNIFFLLSTTVLAFYVFNSTSTSYNYILSVSLSAALLSISSGLQV